MHTDEVDDDDFITPMFVESFPGEDKTVKGSRTRSPGLERGELDGGQNQDYRSRKTPTQPKDHDDHRHHHHHCPCKRGDTDDDHGLAPVTGVRRAEKDTSWISVAAVVGNFLFSFLFFFFFF